MQNGGLLYVNNIIVIIMIFCLVFFFSDESSQFFNLSAKAKVGSWFCVIVDVAVCNSPPAYSSSARMHFVSCVYIYIIYIYIIFAIPFFKKFVSRH